MTRTPLSPRPSTLSMRHAGKCGADGTQLARHSGAVQLLLAISNKLYLPDAADVTPSSTLVRRGRYMAHHPAAVSQPPVRKMGFTCSSSSGMSMLRLQSSEYAVAQLPPPNMTRYNTVNGGRRRVSQHAYALRTIHRAWGFQLLGKINIPSTHSNS
jgi:hypothetical protein